MDLNALKISEKLVPANYLRLAQAAQKSRDTQIRELLEKRKLPEEGWPEEHIEALVLQISSLDSNNFTKKCGLGEREARIACKLVAKRHYNFGHGIGRSGDLLEAQPKAAGSTLLSNLTNALILDLIHQMGLRSCRSCFLVPMATGMSLMLCLLSLKQLRPTAKYVLWSRIDQKSCFKSITSAGLTPITIDTICKGEEEGLKTDTGTFEEKLKQLPLEEILCIYSTTSCFAPRNCDDISGLAILAKQYNVPHLVNNAYGLQSTQLTHRLEEAARVGRVDLFVQSTDKNLMVPVGGAIVAGFQESTVRKVAKTYAGRASSSQSLDVLMTLLTLGKDGYLRYVRERLENFKILRVKLQDFAKTHDARIINTKRNPISIAVTLESLKGDLTQLGSMLYTRGVSGVRVVQNGDTKVIDGHTFENWGSHRSQQDVSYLTVAAALGVTSSEIDIFMKKLTDCWQQHQR